VGNLTKKFENTKGVIRSRNSVRRRPGNTMDKEKNNARQNNKQKTIEWAKRTELKNGDEFGCRGRIRSILQ